MTRLFPRSIVPRSIAIRPPTSLTVAFWSAVTLAAALSALREDGWLMPVMPAQALSAPVPAGWHTVEPRFDAAGYRYRARTDW